MSLLGLIVFAGFAAAVIVVIVAYQDPYWGRYARMRRAADRDWRRHVTASATPKTLPAPEDPELVSRERELAAWNDPQMWRGCSDYPPPSGVKLRERD